MKFMRRPDIDTVARVQIAVQAFLGLGVYGEITRRANGYRVSRLFVYKLVWQLLTLYALEVRAASSVQAIRKEVDRHILLLRLEGHCSLESISQIIKQLGLPNASVGSISQRLTAYARALPREVVSGAPIVFLRCDKPTVSLDVTSAVVDTYGCDGGRISPTRCAVIDAALDGR